MSAPQSQNTRSAWQVPVGGVAAGGASSSLRLWQRLKSISRWLDDSLIGDVIGLVCLVVIIWGVWFVLWVLS